LSAAYLNEFTVAVEYSPNRNYSFHAGASRKFDTGGSVTVPVLTPLSAYSDVKCATDPGRDGVIGTADDNPNGPICAYSIPTANPNRLITNNLYKNYAPGEGTAQYTSYDFLFNKNYSNGWQFLAGYDVSFARAATANPINPNQILYNHNSDLGTWRNAIKMSGLYGVPGIPYFKGHKLNGVQWSSTYTAQSGDWYDRTADITDFEGNKQTFTVDPHMGRYPWTKDWDQRITKRIKITDKQSIELKWDQYNIMNANTIQTFGSLDSSASTYKQPNGTPLSPKTILAPRIYEWSASWRF
jgi:hypothetical protein